MGCIALYRCPKQVPESYIEVTIWVFLERHLPYRRQAPSGELVVLRFAARWQHRWYTYNSGFGNDLKLLLRAQALTSC